MKGKAQVKEIEINLDDLASSYVPRNRPWSSAEIETVRKYRGKVRDADLAEKLGRSLASLRLKAQNLGV
jgi:hypothetical protein